MTGVDQAASQPVDDRLQSAIGRRGHGNPGCRNDPDSHEDLQTSGTVEAQLSNNPHACVVETPAAIGPVTLAKRLSLVKTPN